MECYRIGMFSKINKITVKTLKFYEEVGLLLPAYVDPENGYRYYSTAQMAELHRIMSLRQMGFSIEDIQQIFRGNNLEAVFQQRKRELERSIDREQRQLLQISNYLENMKGEQSMGYEVLLKELPEVTVYSKRMVLSGYADYFRVIPEIGEEVLAANPGMVCREPAYCFVVYHDGEYKEHDIDMEYCEAVEQAGKDTETIHFKTVDRVPLAACVMHKGPYEELSNAYGSLMRWMEQNGYEACGEFRESYIDGIWNREDPADWLTEVQAPVRRKGEQ